MSLETLKAKNGSDEEYLVYPKTLARCITDENGDNLENVLKEFIKYVDKVKIEAELEEIFEIGFGYLSNCLIDINTYYKDYFNKDAVLFNKYSTLIIYSIMLDDVKGYLLSEERLTDERTKMLDQASKLIEDTMINLKEIDGNVVCEVEDILEMVLPKKNKYKPVYAVFAMIAEELGIY